MPCCSCDRDTLKQLMIKKEIVGDLLNHLRLARQRALAAERGGSMEDDWEAGRAAAVAGAQGWLKSGDFLLLVRNCRPR